MAELFELFEVPPEVPLPESISELGPIQVTYDENDELLLRPQEAAVTTTLVAHLLEHGAAGAASRLLESCHSSTCIDALKALLVPVNKDPKNCAGVSAEDYTLLMQALEGATAMLATQSEWHALHELLGFCSRRQKELVFANLMLTQLVDFSDMTAELSALNQSSLVSFKRVCKTAVRMTHNNMWPDACLLLLARRSIELNRKALGGLFKHKDFGFKRLLERNCDALLAKAKISLPKAEQVKDILSSRDKERHWWPRASRPWS